jgi:hypothetical protein
MYSRELAIVMDPIDKKIADVFAAFEREQDPELVYGALNEVEDVHRQTQAEDRDACKRGLSLLLNFLTALDKHIDPKWNPKQKPVLPALPPIPDAPDLVNAQVDLDAIKDPDLRARYEQAIKTHREKRQRYRVQLELRYIEERAIDDLKLFAERCFTSSSAERREFEELLQKSSLSEARKKKFRKLVRPRPWPFG